MAEPDLVNNPEIPTDLKEAGCVWIYQGDHSTQGIWTLQLGPYNKSPHLGAVRHTQMGRGKWVGFQLHLGNPMARTPIPWSHGNYRKQGVAVAKLYRHARKTIPKILKHQLMAGDDA